MSIHTSRLLHQTAPEWRRRSAARSVAALTTGIFLVVADVAHAQAQSDAAGVVPASQQDGEGIRRAALEFLQQQTVGLPGKVAITVAPVFPRGLAACSTLQPFLPMGGRAWGETTVGVRCVGERPWTVYARANISVHATYFTAARALVPGDVLTPADLVARDGDLTTLPQTIVTDRAQAVGAAALIRVSAGMPLRLDMLRGVGAVTVGQSVRVVAKGNGFAVTSEGSVMNNATPGQTVRVKTPNGEIVNGTVTNQGTVEIQF